MKQTYDIDIQGRVTNHFSGSYSVQLNLWFNIPTIPFTSLHRNKKEIINMAHFIHQKTWDMDSCTTHRKFIFFFFFFFQCLHHLTICKILIFGGKSAHLHVWVGVKQYNKASSLLAQLVRVSSRSDMEKWNTSHI